MKTGIDELLKATGGTLVFGTNDAYFDNITTNSKQIKGNDLFIPIVGEKTDGHLYIASAFAQGAKVSLTETDDLPEDVFHYRNEKTLVRVNHTVEALQSFASCYRKNHVNIPYIGITGSVGKTTTREMISATLRSSLSVYTTKGNANSQVGVPITVYETDADAKIGVLELGISEFGEMEKISRIADVDLAVITNIGISHIAQFKTQENILKEKLMILSGEKDQAVLLVNGDDPLIQDLTEEKIHRLGIRPSKKIQIFRFGLSDGNDYKAENISKTRGPADFEFVKMNTGARISVSLSVYGDHMIQNAVAALAVCDQFGLDLFKAAAALGTFEGFEGRGKLMQKNGVTIINDCYNASPASMKAGLKVFHEMPAKGRKICVLADMKELGENELDYHREIGRYINETVDDLDILLTYGPMAELIGETVNNNRKVQVYSFTDFDQTKKQLHQLLKPGDLLFLKGSWSMGLKGLIQE